MAPAVVDDLGERAPRQRLGRKEADRGIGTLEPARVERRRVSLQAGEQDLALDWPLLRRAWTAASPSRIDRLKSSGGETGVG
jgi:hypothetical protein